MSETNSLAGRNLDLPSKEIALEQIFTATGYRVPASKITFGAASKLDPFPFIQTDENSFVPADISELEDGRFVGDNGFLYRRLDLADIPDNEEISSVPLTYPFRVHEALAMINSFLGTQLDETDVENDYYADDSAPVILRAKRGSLAWFGQRSLTPTSGGAQFLFPQPVMLGFREYDGGEQPERVTPYEGLSIERLVAMLNEEAGTEYALGVDYTFGPVAAVSGPGYNSRIRINPIDPAFTPQDVYYNRLDLDALTRLPEGSILPVTIHEVPFAISGILADINLALGLDLMSSEVFNTVYNHKLERYVIQVRSGGSVAWRPSSFIFEADHVLPVGRVTESGLPRLTEDGQVREMEDSYFE